MPIKFRTIARVGRCQQIVEGEWQATKHEIAKALARIAKISGHNASLANVSIQMLPQTADDKKYMVTMALPWGSVT